MRYYGLKEWLRTVSTMTGIDVQTLLLFHIDVPAAILALSSGGGCRTSADDSTDTADGCYRLLVNLTKMQPYRGKGSDRIAHTSMRAYARNRGFTLNLGPSAMYLIEEHSAGRLDEHDVRRALRSALLESDAREAPAQNGLKGVTVSISRPISEPDPASEPAVNAICDSVAGWLRRSGAKVLLPEPVNRRTSAGHIENLSPMHAKPSSAYVTNRELLTRSIKRVTSGHVNVIVNDGRSVGVQVEREWALRLGIPIIEFSLTNRTHPHQDGPEFVTTIPVAGDLIEDAVRTFQQTIPELLWLILDEKAIAEAEVIRNEALLAHLRAAWETLTPTDKEGTRRALRMSVPYIEGLLSSERALALASEKQLRGLKRFLGVRGTHKNAVEGQLHDVELARLVAAAERAGLAGLEMVRAVHIAGDLQHRALQRQRIASDATADRAIHDSLAVMRRWPTNNE